MVVDGQHKDGGLVRRAWDLIAEVDDGPFIPAMAAAAIIRKYLNGRRPAAGARSALRGLGYRPTFEHFFARKAIFVRRSEISTSECSRSNLVQRLDPRIRKRDTRMCPLTVL